eukprot:1968051-Amphidinium_carterae.1
MMPQIAFSTVLRPPSNRLRGGRDLNRSIETSFGSSASLFDGFDLHFMIEVFTECHSGRDGINFKSLTTGTLSHVLYAAHTIAAF